MDDYTLPPLRSAGGLLGPHLNDVSNDGPERATKNESERLRTERRLALQKEAARMREMLAAKERELMEL
jgi:hypothetical protein